MSVCLPNEGHYEATLEIIRAGVPLLVEKPLVFALAQADTLIAEAAERDLWFGINFNHRYAKPVQLAKAASDAGELGAVSFATWRFGGEIGDSEHAHASLIETQCRERATGDARAGRRALVLAHAIIESFDSGRRIATSGT